MLNFHLISGSQDSSITDGGYGYDMVVAVTQSAINNGIKTYIYYMDEDTFIEAYDEDGVYIDYRKVLKAINDPNIPPTSPDYIDLFNIDPAKPTEREKEAIEAAKKFGMRYAAKARLGMPKGVKPTDMHKSVDLKTGNGKTECCYYYAYFAEFEPLIIGENDDHETELVHYVQSNSNPWVFTYLVNLGLQDESYNDVPTQVQDEMKQTHPTVTDFDSMFSIQSLVIKFSTASFAESPSDLPGGEKYKKYIENIFMWSYMHAIVKAGGVSLGYTMKEKNHVNSNSVIVPTNYDFCISEFSDPSKTDLYTLNYLVALDNKPLPEKRMPFKWDWVDEGENIDGVMAISRAKIYELLKGEFEPIINGLTLEPTIKVEIDNPVTAHFTYGMHHVDVNAQYSEYPGPGTTSNDPKWLECNFRSYKEDSDTFVPIWGNMSSEYTINSTLKVQKPEKEHQLQNVIICETRVKCWLHVNVCGGVSEGNIYDHTLTSKVTVQIDGDGTVHFKTGDMTDKDNGTTFEISTWSKIIAIDFTDLIKGVIETITGRIDSAISSYKNSFIRDIEGTNDWLFPGMKTFAFKNVEFSKSQDLTTELKYCTPE